jgi:hypothetical protein
MQMVSYTDDTNKPKMSQDERNKLMQEFLSKGGQIKKLKPGIAEGAGSLNRSKKLQWSEREIIKQEIVE